MSVVIMKNINNMYVIIMAKKNNMKICSENMAKAKENERRK